MTAWSIAIATPLGSAETAFGEILNADFQGYRDQIVISSKAGYGMWPGPYMADETAGNT